jgi:uncharacterized membrane protein YjgN (DUF898 family)
MTGLPQQQPQRQRRSLRSVFKGTAGKYFFLRIGCALLSLIPIIGLPNSMCILLRYKINNREIVGIPLEFNGKSGELLKKLIVWGFFTIITIGIYGLVLAPIRYQEWVTSHTVFGPLMV